MYNWLIVRTIYFQNTHNNFLKNIVNRNLNLSWFASKDIGHFSNADITHFMFSQAITSSVSPVVRHLIP